MMRDDGGGRKEAGRRNVMPNWRYLEGKKEKPKYVTVIMLTVSRSVSQLSFKSSVVPVSYLF